MATYAAAILAAIILPLICFSSMIRSQDHADRQQKALYRLNQPKFQCESEGFYPDSSDCSVFYRCIDWGESSENSVQSRFTSFKFQCGGGSIFDPDTNSCVHSSESSRAECRDDSAEPLLFNFPRADALQADDSNANQVDYGVVQSQGNNPPPAQQPTYAKPGDGSQIEPMSEVDNTIGEQPPRVTRSPPCNAEGFFPIENDCSHFYRCVASGSGFSKYEFSCGEGTVWDPDNNACNHAWAVQRTDCKSAGAGGNGSGQGEGNPEQEGNPNPGQGNPDQEGGYPNQGQGNPDQGGGYPNQGQGNPDQEGGYPNQGQGNPDQGPSSVTPEPEQNLPGGSTSAAPSSGYPSSTELLSPSQTTPGTGGSTPSSEEGSSGGQPNGENGSNQSPGTQGGSCPSEGFHPVEGDCKKFIRCVSNGGGYTRYEFECAEGTVWDVDAVTCNYPHAVQNSNCKADVGDQTATTGGGSNNNNEAGTSDNQQTTSSQQGSTSGSSQQTASTTSGQTSSSDQQTTSMSSQTSSSTSGQHTSSTSSQQTSSTSSQQTSSASSSQQTSSTSSQQSSSTLGQQTTSSGQQTSSTSGQQTTSSGQQTSSTSGQQTTSSGQQTSSTSGQQTTSSGQQTSSTSGQQSSTSSGSNTQTTSSGSQQSTGSSQTGTTSGNNETSSQNKADQCTSEGFFPSSSNCNKFYRCVKNEGNGYNKYEFNCGPGTVWDPDNNVCNHPWAVQNEKCRTGGNGAAGSQPTNSTEPTPSGASTSASTSGESTTPGGNMTAEPSSGNSTTPGYNTSKPPSSGPTTSKPTSPMKNPSQNVTTVRPPSSNTTTTKPQSTSTKPSTTTSSTKPSENNSTGTTSKPDSENSTKPSGNTTSTGTTTPATTTGGNNTESTTNAAGTTSQNSTKPASKITCTKAGFYPHPDNCKKFYRCVDWDGDKGERFSVYHFDCPAGTIFDPSLNTCNHEESVYPSRDCSGSSQATEPTPGSSTNATSPDEVTEEPTTPGDNSTTTSAEGSTGNTTEPFTEQTTTASPEASTNGTITTVNSTPGSTDYTTSGTGETSPLTTQSTQTTESSTGATSPAVTSVASTLSPEDGTTTPSSQITTDSSATTYPTTTDMTTVSSTSSNEKCPELGPDQFALVCPTGFRRHPKYCNLFYQCTTSQSNEIKVLTLSCTNGTVYDDHKIQCLPPDQAKKCDGSMMDTRSLRQITDNSITPVPVKSDKTICPNEGSFAYKDDCRLFYKCKKDGEGKLNGFIYQCPEGFAYWSVSKRCEKTEKVPCDSGKKSSGRPTLAPVETRNVGHK